jgi:hypothetical protein
VLAEIVRAVRGLVTGVKAHALADRGLDLYETPRVAVEALLRAENLDARIWEPCAGRGAITDVLREHGHRVAAADIADYGVPGQESGRDFLEEERAPEGFDQIVTNPPFSLAQAFVEHGLALCERVVMLMRLAFLESERRSPILDNGQLARVHVFKKRLPMMHRDGWTGPRASSAVAYAWFVWERAHAGPAQLNRI